ncbi:hypothetical protein N7488_011201 [Penicillium malachiteum]|nr:hypothetical protein N7488_011201 [Penicillium malachiteum]
MAPKNPGKGYVEFEENALRSWVPDNPHLPPIPIKSSFGYGSQVLPVARRPAQLHARPGTTNLKEIARSVNEAVENSELKAISSREAREQKLASSKRESARRRRTKREPTPDETQLHQGLREATASPTKDSFSQRSDPTPSPPIPRDVSTDSSPVAEPPSQRRLSVMSNSPLYPSPLQRGGHDAYGLNTPDRQSRQSSVDNTSEVSWSLERDIHEDDLRRTRPSTHGRNITAPPRRPSGLGNIIPSDIPEEDEDDEEDYEDDESEGNDEEDLEKTSDEDEPPQSEYSDHSNSELTSQVMERLSEGWTSVRTIIPSLFRSEPTLEPLRSSSPEERIASKRASSIRSETVDQVVSPTKFNRGSWVRLVFAILLPLTLAFVFRSGYLDVLHLPDLPSFPSVSQYTPNTNESATVQRLKKQISKVNDQMSSMSRELIAVRSENARASKPTYVMGQHYGHQADAHKINFLATAMGVLVDPYQTSPSSVKLPSFFRRVALTVLGQRSKLRGPAPPLAALSPWYEVGDCWCTAPRNGISQLSLILGRSIVPEEVVIEHIPSGATLDPGVAPKEIELWAHFKVVPVPSDSLGTRLSRWIPWGSPRVPQSPEPVSSRTKGLGGYNIPGDSSLHDVVMNTLRATNRYDPDSAFSDDPLLGSNYYRIAKMRYEIFSEYYVQRFGLNSIIDIPTIRVDKVVFRVKSNWGSNNTCIYRLKLHGHI